MPALPKRQQMQEGESESIRGAADEARMPGDNLSARINYESAPKMAIYEHDREALKELLELATGLRTSRGSGAITGPYSRT